MVHIPLLKCTLVLTTCLNFFFFSVVAETDPGLAPHIKTVVSAARLTQDAADFISGTSSCGSTDPRRHFSTKTRFSSVDWGENCDRQIPFSISWGKFAEARVVWFQWSSKDWGRAIRRTPGLPFWISGLIVEKTCAGESSRATQKHRNNQQSLKGTH